MLPRPLVLLGLLLSCDAGARDRASPSATEGPTPTSSGALPSRSGSTLPAPASLAEPARSAVAEAPTPKTCSPACSTIERCEGGACVPACPAGRIFVPATGPEGFVLRGGSGDASARRSLPSQRPHVVVLTHPFCMDATEVTVRAYRACVEAGSCPKPRRFGLFSNYPDALDHPVNKIPWRDALGFCHYAGGELPTEAQWEWAATGGDGRPWAWGSEPPDCSRADYTQGHRERPASGEGCNGGGTSPVGTHPEGDRVWPNGHIHDLSGNVWEWTLDNYRPFRSERETDPGHRDDDDFLHVVRGGGWNRSARGIRVDYRAAAPVDYRVPGLGFRCVMNPRGV